MNRLNRLALMTCIGLLGLTGGFAVFAADWAAYQQAFVAGDGRVRDPSQNSISHSEGQGYGLLLAVMNDDRTAFDRILKWTTDNLQVRRDALLAWSWGRRPNGDWNVIDYNNASDGDILIAYALLKGSQRWGHRPYREAAQRIVRDIRTQLGLTVYGHQLIAPAYFGFHNQNGHSFNTGYMVLSAFEEFARADDAAFWQRVLNDSRGLLDQSVFSNLKLPADWVVLQNGKTTVDRTRSPFFGYEAIRVPLYLAWQDDRQRLAVFSDYLKFVETAGYLPRRVNLIDETVAADEAPAGFYAVMGTCAERLQRQSLARNLLQKAAEGVAREPEDYFSNTLYLLARGKTE
jgi:endoglucanase